MPLFARRSNYDLPEVHDPNEPWKQVVVSNGLEIVPGEDPQFLPSQNDKEVSRPNALLSKGLPSISSGKSRRTVAQKCLLIAVLLIILLGLVLGIVQGLRSRENSRADDLSPHVSQAPAIPNSERFLPNSAIASALCPDGQRWVFFQDADNNLRGASHSSDGWSFLSNSTINAEARPNSPLDASCVDSPTEARTGEAYFSSGRLVLLSYVGASNAVSATYFNGGPWDIVHVWVDLPYTDIDTRALATSQLSLTISILAPSFQRNSSRYTPWDPWTSVAVAYQDASAYPAMMNLLGDKHPSQGTRVLMDSLDQFDYGLNSSSFQYIKDYSLTGLSSCLYNTPWILADGFAVEGTDTAIDDPNFGPNSISFGHGNLTTMCVGTRDVVFANYNATGLGYLNGTIIGFNYVWNDSFGSEVNPLPVPSNRTDMKLLKTGSNTILLIYLTEQKLLAVVSMIPAGLVFSTSSPMLVTTSTIELPSFHFAVSLLEDSDDIYVYYCANDTHFSELVLNIDTASWSSPTFITMQQLNE